MDSALPQSVIHKKKRKAFVITVVVLVAALLLAWLLKASFSNSIKASEITTSIVEIGTIENTLNASGEILPEFEEIITSPISASIQKVLIDAGTHVKPGQAILLLDKSSTQTEYEKQKFQLESKRNSIQKLKVELDKSFFDIQSNNDIKQMRINSLRASLEDAKRLFKAGGGTREDIEQAELNLKVAELEKKQLENEIRSKQKTMQLEMRESEISASIQQNDLLAMDKKLKQADIVANREGVVTWVNKNIGASIQAGESLARIADLSGFKATGTLSDTYLDKLHAGMPVIIVSNEEQVRGTVSNVYPSVQNGIVSFDIRLQQTNAKILRPNLRVEVYLVTSVSNNVMRVANGAAFRSGTSVDVYVMRDGKAEKRRITTGLSNFDYVEIKGDVKPGDVVITSDMSRFTNAKEITIKP